MSHHAPCDYDRTLTLFGVRICTRCLGMSGGLLAGCYTRQVFVDISDVWLFIGGLCLTLPAAFDFAAHELIKTYRSTNPRRFITGGFFGFAVGLCLARMWQGAGWPLICLLVYIVFLEFVVAGLFWAHGHLDSYIERYVAAVYINENDPSARYLNGMDSRYLWLTDGGPFAPAYTDRNMIIKQSVRRCVLQNKKSAVGKMMSCRLVSSFRYALEGLLYLLHTQPNAKIHMLATTVVCGLSCFCGISKYEWCWIVVSISLVWAGEALNTSIEMLADIVHADEHPGIKAIKDMAAGAVLALAFGAVVIGIIVFWPYFMVVR